MHIPLYRALKDANVSDDAAAQVVREIESYIAMKIADATKPLEAKMELLNKSTNEKIDRVDGKIMLFGLILTAFTMLAATAQFWGRLLPS